MPLYIVPSEKPENTFVPTPQVNWRDERNIEVVFVNVYDVTPVVIRGFTIVWLETPLAVIYIVPATAVPVDGIAALGGVVTYNIFPDGVAKMVATGDEEEPIVPRLELDRVQPTVLFPPVIYVLEPFMYIPFASAGDPLVIRRRLLLT